MIEVREITAQQNTNHYNGGQNIDLYNTGPQKANKFKVVDYLSKYSLAFKWHFQHAILPSGKRKRTPLYPIFYF